MNYMYVRTCVVQHFLYRDAIQSEIRQEFDFLVSWHVTKMGKYNQEANWKSTSVATDSENIGIII